MTTPTTPLKGEVERIRPKLIVRESNEVPDNKAPLAICGRGDGEEEGGKEEEERGKGGIAKFIIVVNMIIILLLISDSMCLSSLSLSPPQTLPPRPKFWVTRILICHMHIHILLHFLLV